MADKIDYTRCAICDQKLGTNGVVVSESASYVPFIEDWRGGLVEMVHPACYAEANGLPAFLEVLARYDEWVRRGFHEYRDEIRSLKRETR